MTSTEHRADIALDDTVRIDGESFTWVVGDIDPDNHQVLVKWDRMNDDGVYVEWVHPLSINRVED